jgi:putative hemolysin
VDLFASLDEPPGQLLLAEIISTGPNYFYIFSFAAIAVLLFMSGMISASEVAFFSLRADDLEECRESDDRNSKNIIDLLRKPRQLLATILIMNNFVNVGVVTISTFLMWDMAGTHKPAEIIVGFVTFGATFAITFFGEIIPKVYATQRNMVIARLMGGVWKFLENICKPISWPLLNMSNLIERRFKKKGYSSTVEELNHALELTTGNNGTTAEEKDILKGIVNFGTLTVRQVMKSRTDVSAVDVELNFKELMEQVNKSGFSRIPVYRESLDTVEGVLYTKDLLPHLDEGEQFKWQKLLRKGLFVPETKRLDSLLKDFQSKRVHMAVVVDEFDEVNQNYQKIDDRNFVFEGKTSLHDLYKALDVEPSVFDEVRGESESLGGLILELHGALPIVDEQIIHDHFVFTILAVDQKRIKKVKVTLLDKKEEDEED